MIHLDVEKFFDQVSWDLVLLAVNAVTGCCWVLVYVERWLAAPLERRSGTLEERNEGAPDRSALRYSSGSPLASRRWGTTTEITA
jgi:retron-type reverse transcriptase